MLDKTFENYSVSHGTLKTEDLTLSLVEFIRINAPDEYKKLNKQDLDIVDLFKNDVSFEDLSPGRKDAASWFLNEVLFDLLNDIAPENCYFGAHIGDASDFGFWEYEEEE